MTPRRWIWHYAGFSLVALGAIVGQAAESVTWTSALCLGGLAVQYLAMRPVIRAWRDEHREDTPT